MIGAILAYIVIGLVVGAVARLVVPGPNPMPIWVTILLGIVGSVVGGLITRAILDRGHSIIEFGVSVAVAVGLVLLLGKKPRASG